MQLGTPLLVLGVGAGRGGGRCAHKLVHRSTKTSS